MTDKTFGKEEKVNELSEEMLEKVTGIIVSLKSGQRNGTK